MNSMGVNPFVNSLYQDLKDGLVLLQVSWVHRKAEYYVGIQGSEQSTNQMGKLWLKGGKSQAFQTISLSRVRVGIMRHEVL